ncbi:unnamed protein product [Rangifer tarandus platyrhynchus]|uniref:Uncharacterized protein n=1 Tax=Rangifer tarandus platyrhynchus TaxID=3082113 RepID=A0ABN8YZF7_RANTA|nr:unnamed protein product [Rangifer tarandus platyrhynchus]
MPDVREVPYSSSSISSAHKPCKPGGEGRVVSNCLGSTGKEGLALVTVSAYKSMDFGVRGHTPLPPPGPSPSATVRDPEPTHTQIHKEMMSRDPHSQHFRKEGGFLLDLPPEPERDWAEVAEKTRTQLPSTDPGGLVAPGGPSLGTSRRASHAAESMTTS